MHRRLLNQPSVAVNQFFVKKVLRVSLVDVRPFFVQRTSSIYARKIDLQKEVIHVLVLVLDTAYILSGCVVKLPEVACHNVTNVDADLVLLEQLIGDCLLLVFLLSQKEKRGPSLCFLNGWLRRIH